MKKVLFIMPYPLGISPGQRFRFEQYLHYMESNEIKVTLSPFFNTKSLVSKNYLTLAGKILLGIINRIVSLINVPSSDFIFIFRESLPFGPPLYEYVLAYFFRKKIIYDFDDAIWLTDNLSESVLEKTVRWRSKVSTICKLSYKVSAGNEYLANYAKAFNKNVIINPTTIDAEHVHKASLKRISNESNRIVIGWTGSSSTLKYLHEIERVLQRLQLKFNTVDFCVIANRPPDLKLNRLLFKPWTLQSEISDLAQIDIGMMPLPNDEWTKGKCGFKALQYMAMEIPTIASAVGVNTKIINHGVNGFLVSSLDEWETLLTSLIESKALREKIGRAGRVTVERNYSVESNKNNFLSLFN